jgi:hypothetical protein
MNQKKREVIYFALLFLLFFLAVKLINFWKDKVDLNIDIIIIIVGIIYVSITVGIFFLAKLQTTNEKFWDVNDYAKCKGGPYFWQGDSENSKRCRELASTPEGRIGISGYNCPVGYVGQPGLPFYYTPLSDDSWKNERCDERSTCKGTDVGQSSFTKQYP